MKKAQFKHNLKKQARQSKAQRNNLISIFNSFNESYNTNFLILKPNNNEQSN